MPLPSGLLNQTFYPQTLTEVSDGQGGVSLQFTDGTSFRGRLSSLNSNEILSNNKLTLNSTHKLFTDYMAITPTQRIRNNANTRFFDVVGIINPSDANSHLEIYVKEIDSNG
jgi:head-tail adaptor